jgi:alkylation response protein AidB-like acyl-CoA dehydrogenase
VTVRPIEKLNGKKAFAEVFFDNARVPVENLLGEEGKGWSVAMATAGFERGLMLRSPARFQNTARKLVELYRENADACDPSLREAVVDCWMGAEAYTLDTYRTVSRMLEGGKIGAEASLNKIFWSELDVKMHETALRILGDRAELLSGAPAAEGVGDWLDGFLFAISGPIYAGTNEIQRNVIAERILGLPRS